jgi:hypothetical protein
MNTLLGRSFDLSHRSGGVKIHEVSGLRQTSTPSKKPVRIAKHDFVQWLPRTIGVRPIKNARVKPDIELNFQRKKIKLGKDRATKKRPIETEFTDLPNLAEDKQTLEKKRISWTHPISKDRNDTSKRDTSARLNRTSECSLHLKLANTIPIENLKALAELGGITDGAAKNVIAKGSDSRTTNAKGGSSPQDRFSTSSLHSSQGEDKELKTSSFVKSVKRSLLGDVSSVLNPRSHPESKILKPYPEPQTLGRLELQTHLSNLGPRVVQPSAQTGRLNLYLLQCDAPSGDAHKRGRREEMRDIPCQPQDSVLLSEDLLECKSMVSRRLQGQDNSVFNWSKEDFSPSASVGKFSKRRTSKGRNLAERSLFLQMQQVTPVLQGRKGEKIDVRSNWSIDSESNRDRSWDKAATKSSNFVLSKLLQQQQQAQPKKSQPLDGSTSAKEGDNSTDPDATDRPQAFDNIDILMEKFAKQKAATGGVMTERKSHPRDQPIEEDQGHTLAHSALQKKRVTEEEEEQQKFVKRASIRSKPLFVDPPLAEQGMQVGADAGQLTELDLGGLSKSDQQVSSREGEDNDGRWSKDRDKISSCGISPILSKQQPSKQPQAGKRELIGGAVDHHVTPDKSAGPRNQEQEIQFRFKGTQDSGKLASMGFDENSQKKPLHAYLDFDNKADRPSSPKLNQAREEAKIAKLASTAEKDNIFKSQDYHLPGAMAAELAPNEQQRGDTSQRFSFSSRPVDNIHRNDSPNGQVKIDGESGRIGVHFTKMGGLPRAPQHGYSQSMSTTNKPQDPTQSLQDTTDPRQPNQPSHVKSKLSHHVDVQTMPPSPVLTPSQFHVFANVPTTSGQRGFDSQRLTQMLHEELRVGEDSVKDPLVDKKKLIANQLVNIFDKMDRLDLQEKKPQQDYREIISRGGSGEFNDAPPGQNASYGTQQYAQQPGLAQFSQTTRPTNK